MRRVWRECTGERGMVLIIALFIMAVLLVAGVFLVRMSATEGDIAYNMVWAEGSFFAADGAISVGLDQLAPQVGPRAAQLHAPSIRVHGASPGARVRAR